MTYWRFFLLLVLASIGSAAERATQPAKLPFIAVDVQERQVRVECQAIRVDAPLEFFCVAMGGPEHEAVLRTAAKPSDVHLALLMIGLEPGKPVRFSEATQKWLPPDGPPIRVSAQFKRGDETITLPAGKLIRSIQERKPMPDVPFVFTGSRLMEDGRYAADVTGYLVSIVNFDLSPIDVPQIASNANDTLEWQVNPDIAPEMGTKVTMILEPVGKDVEGSAKPGASAPDSPDSNRARLSDVQTDQHRIDQMQALWTQRVAPHDVAAREAAKAQYDVIRQLRSEQQRLIDEADRIQRLIDEFERKYQDMTTPRPETTGTEGKP